MSTVLILASNSTNPGSGYLSHLEKVIRDTFKMRGKVAFVPYAIADLDGYATVAEDKFKSLGVELVSIHRDADPTKALTTAEGVFVGGGNTFRLLDRLIRYDLIQPIRELVANGGPYMGTSAGSNVACPTIQTTNDMPIVHPRTFAALDLVPFQINPHYVERDPDTAHGGETRTQRLAEFHEENATPVIGLPEGSWLAVDRTLSLYGPSPATLFRRGMQPTEIRPGVIPEEYLGNDAPPSSRKL